jgi:hypothetical protein
MSVSFSETQLFEEYNQLTSFELCYQAQELIQDLINRVIETVGSIRALSILLLVSDQSNFLQRKQRLEEFFSSIELTFARLRVLGALIHKRKVLSEKKTEQIEHRSISDDQSCQEEKNKPSIEQLTFESSQLKEQIRLKNSYLKLAIEKISDIIWNINSIRTVKQ